VLLEACSFGRFDLIIVHSLEGLPMLEISSPPTNIMSWKVHKSLGEITSSYILHTRVFGTYLLGGIFTLQKNYKVMVFYM
jgi:hypothetical protein